MKLVGALLLLAGLAAVRGECPNACSGNGVCGAKDACACYDNWMGGDCSQRVCPFGLAFVDTPHGDLNHDGAVDSSAVLDGRGNAAVKENWQGSTTGLGHFYTECSGKGTCDRSTGECGCFDGYTGSSCQRTTCPNGCSGHGQCFTLREIAAGHNVAARTHSSVSVGRNFRISDFSYGEYTTSGVSEVFDYNLWDADKNQACVCDKGYFGPDCSLRECPKGNDPLTTDTKHCGGSTCSGEVQYMQIEMGASGGNFRMYFEWTDGEEYDRMVNGATALRSSIFTMRSGLTGDQYAELIQDALESFPDGVLNGVTVTCNGGETAAAAWSDYVKCSTAVDTAGDLVELKLDFSNGPSGNVNALVSKLASSADITATVKLGMWAGGSATSSAGTAIAAGIAEGGSTAPTLSNGAAAAKGQISAATSVDGTNENSICSNRGICDNSSGECNCFGGYTREDCSVQSALAM